MGVAGLHNFGDPNFPIAMYPMSPGSRWLASSRVLFCLFRRAECDHVLGKAGLQAGEERAETLRESKMLKVLLLVSFHNLCVSLGETRSSRRNEPTSPARAAESDSPPS